MFTEVGGWWRHVKLWHSYLLSCFCFIDATSLLIFLKILKYFCVFSTCVSFSCLLQSLQSVNEFLFQAVDSSIDCGLAVSVLGCS